MAAYYYEWLDFFSSKMNWNFLGDSCYLTSTNLVSVSGAPAKTQSALEVQWIQNGNLGTNTLEILKAHLVSFLLISVTNEYLISSLHLDFSTTSLIQIVFSSFLAKCAILQYEIYILCFKKNHLYFKCLS